MGQLRTGSLESLRERNRLRVIDALRTRGAISRADIARQTGLSRSTVSSLVGDLQTAGLVVERVAESAAPAAPPRGHALDDLGIFDSGFAICRLLRFHELAFE